MPSAPRIGVVGAGGLGVHHVRILRDLAGDRFAGFVDQNPARAAEVSSSLQVMAWPSLDALLKEVDAVSVVVPTTAHFAVTSEALRRGKHVFVEKPFTATIEEADELLALQQQAGVVVQVGHVERFNRAIRAAMPFVDGPLFIESDRLAPFSPRGSDVAVVLDLMIHDIDLVCSLVNSPVNDVSAAGIPVLTPQVDIANARLTFASGAVANVTASRVSRERIRKLRIFQRSGYLSLDLAAGQGEFFRLRGDFDPMALARAPRTVDDFVERIALEAPEAEPLVMELSQFLGAVAGQHPVTVDGVQGREALSVALRIVSEIDRSLIAIRQGGKNRAPHGGSPAAT
ncbi:MAG: Gfo/Idh/MocA family oxidoreductase [Phycisphaerae bacterium]|nr:Gfo/Idh/MocA family oxidoreductase [Gemmatimonadaceae bacterium]